MEILMTKTRLEKNPETKTTYIEVETKTEPITEKQYHNITNNDTLSFFRRLGGCETAQKGYTAWGYNIVRLISSSPDRSIKTIREFKFN